MLIVHDLIAIDFNDIVLEANVTSLEGLCFVDVLQEVSDGGIGLVFETAGCVPPDFSCG